MFSMMESWQFFSQTTYAFPPWQVGALIGYFSGGMSSLFEIYKVHNQSDCEQSFIGRVRAHTPYILLLTQMICIRTATFDATFFHFMRHPKTASISKILWATLLSCICNAPVAYLVHICITESVFMDAMRRIKTMRFANFLKVRGMATVEIIVRISAYNFFCTLTYAYGIFEK